MSGLLKVQAAGEAVTNDKGEFLLTPAATGLLNLEAVKDSETKAWKAQVSYLSTASAPVTAGTLTLGPTGTITGRVTAPSAPSVTNFLGVDVFIPGSSYVAKTDAPGTYSIAGVPAGSFDLVATKAGLGSAHVEGVFVRSRETTTAPDLALAVSIPSIKSVVPANGGPGAVVNISGENFAASTGETLQVTFNGAISTSVERKSDRTIGATVPVGATSGDLVVNVSGLVSKGLLFNVLKTIRLSAGDRDLLAGSKASYTVTADDTTGAAVPVPGVVFALIGGGATASVDGATATVAGDEPGDAVLTVSSGTLSQAARIHVFKVGGVTLDKSSLELNVPPPDGIAVAEGYQVAGTLKAAVQASDRADRAVEWSALPTGLLTIAPGTGGLATVTAKAGTKGGKVVVTAKATDDDRHLATASVNIANDANFFLEFE